MLLERFVCGRSRSNAYVFSPDGREALLVDAGVGAYDRVVDLVEAEGLEPRALMLTHGHPDHIWTARRLSERYEVPVFIHAADLRWLTDPATGGQLPVVRLAGAVLGRARKMRPRRLLVVADGQTVEAGAIRVEILHTPGHSRGSACLVVGDVCFAGDTVFSGSIGAAIFPGGNRYSLRESVRSKLLPLPDRLALHPGHGAPTSVGAERAGWERFIAEG